MIRYVKGDLLQDDAEALVNTVNTVGVMGKGIALQFREAFPANYRAYRQACKDRIVDIGRMFVTEEPTLGSRRLIINFPTKRHWRKPSEYQFIERGLEALRHEIETRGIKSIAIPPLGTNNGGLDWDKVNDLMRRYLGDIDSDIRIYQPSDVIHERMLDERPKLTPARAMLLDVLCDMVACGEFASVFAAEKVVYFLKRMGCDGLYRISFKPYYYGPYSGGKVAHVLYHLNGSYIKGMSAMEIKPFNPLAIAPETRKDVTDYLSAADMEAYRELADKAKAFLTPFYSTHGLELLASVDYILTHDPRMRSWRSLGRDRLVENLTAALNDWSQRKGRMFTRPQFLNTALDHLIANGSLLTDPQKH